VSALAKYTVYGRRFTLISYRDPAGAKCVAVDAAGARGIPECDIGLSPADPANAAIQNMGGGVLAMYGRAGDNVRRIEAVTAAGEETAQPVYAPGNDQRYFVLLITSLPVREVAAVTPAGKVHLGDLRATLNGF
jgi:hypothetical protein